MAWHDIQARYRGSILGPWWITISMAALIGGLTLLNSQLFHMTARDYLPWVATGFLIWNVISPTIVDGADAFISAAGMLRQGPLPMLIFVWRILLRNMLQFLHNLVVIVIAAIWVGFWTKSNVLLAIAGLAAIYVNLAWIVLIVGIASARFRDVPQVVAALMQLSLFLTPVFWLPSGITQHLYVLHLNPFYYMIDAVRSPIVGAALDHRTWPALVVMAVVGWLVAFLVFVATRRRIVHFL